MSDENGGTKNTMICTTSIQNAAILRNFRENLPKITARSYIWTWFGAWKSDNLIQEKYPKLECQLGNCPNFSVGMTVDCN
jgi:hypothetical protein